MEILVNNRMIKLNDNDVAVAQKLVNSFISSVKNRAATNKKLEMYLATIVVMHITTGDVLKSIEPDVMQALANYRPKEDSQNG